MSVDTELTSAVDAAYQMVRDDHDLFNPTISFEVGGPGGVAIANTYTWECGFRPKGEPMLTLERVKQLATEMQRALQATLAGYSVRVDAPVLDGQGYRIFVRVVQSGKTLTMDPSVAPQRRSL